MTLTVIINRNSGRILKEGRKAFLEKLKAALGDTPAMIKFVAPANLPDALKNYKTTPGQSGLIVGGGDGTLASAASILGKRQIPFGILPLGTMNLFAKDLGLPADPYECARLYQNFESRKIDMASVNGSIFLCNVMLGAGVKLAQQREEERENKGFIKWIRLGHALIKRMASKKSYAMKFHYDGQSVKNEITSAVIANNQYGTAPGPQNSLRKQSLSEGQLGIYTIQTEGTLQTLAVLAKLAIGFWQNDAAIESFATSQLSVTNGYSRLSLLIDGELEKMRTPLVFKIHPLALELLVPTEGSAPP